ncbi:MAG: mechanosensitive ion channel family protein [Streptosporangiales bacterium]|jgi:small-conductance mechanosensitive channel|nr:mechanosensitive ion channel family protein [Streptosporangiales bacterium]
MSGGLGILAGRHDIIGGILTGPVDLVTLIEIAVSAGLGVLLSIGLRIGIQLLQKKAVKTAWKVDDLVLTLARIIVPSCVFLLGLWGALGALPLTNTWHHYIGIVIEAVMVAIITIACARVAGTLVQSRAESHSGTSGSSTIFVNITRVIVLSLGLLLLLDTLGIKITPILTALGVGGLAVALALQDTLEQLFAGIHILASHQIQPGAYILMDNGMEGYVQDTNWRNTIIRQTSNNFVVVPNDTLAKSVVTNYHQPDQQMSVTIPVGVAYDSDLEYIERLATEVGREIMEKCEGGVPGYEPIIRFTDFGQSNANFGANFGINFGITLRASEATTRGLVTHQFIKRFHHLLRAEKVELAYPALSISQSERLDARELEMANFRED